MRRTVNADTDPTLLPLLGERQTGGSVRRNPARATANIATADAVDPATTMALVNELKAKINALMAAMRASGTLAQ